MNIAINARFLLYPYSGIGQYTYNLISTLNKNTSRHKLFFLSPIKNFPEGAQISSRDEIENLVYLKEPSIRHRGLRKYLWETVTIPRWCKKHEINLIHHLYPVPLRKKIRIKQIVTVHDTIPWTDREYRRSLKTKMYQYLVLKNLRHADRIIAVSNSTKQDFIKCNKFFPFEHIPIIYQGYDPIYQSQKSPEQLQPILEKYGITNSFFLYVGGFDPRKNVKTLLEAFKKGIAQDFEIDLVIVGGKTNESKLLKTYDQLKPLVKENNIKYKGKVILTGFIPSEELACLYQSCLAFINLSKREGFNIPVIEAASCGAAIILSNIPTHREISGGDVLFCNPEDKEDCASKMKELINNDDLRQQLIMQSGKITEQYSWDKTGMETISLYENLSL